MYQIIHLFIKKAIIDKKTIMVCNLHTNIGISNFFLTTVKIYLTVYLTIIY